MEINLKCSSSHKWLDCVLNNFNEFLKDHADCERKASSMAMSFVAKYPDRTAIIPELIHTGIEELEHLRLVYKIMEKRGIQLNHSIPEDLYVKQLIKACHSGREERFRDRLIVAAIVENRGFERFKMISDHIQDEELQKFYHMIYTSEARHAHSFTNMACRYFPEDEVQLRWLKLTEVEADILTNLEIRPSLH